MAIKEAGKNAAVKEATVTVAESGLVISEERLNQLEGFEEAHERFALDPKVKFFRWPTAKERRNNPFY